MKRHRYSDEFGQTPALLIDLRVMVYGLTYGRPLRAKLDTGADMTALPKTVIDELRPLQYGRRQAHGFGGSINTPTYLVDLVLEGRRYAAEVVAYDRAYALLGRDVLNQLVLVADGPAEIFWFRDPPRPKRSAARV